MLDKKTSGKTMNKITDSKWGMMHTRERDTIDGE